MYRYCSLFLISFLLIFSSLDGREGVSPYPSVAHAQSTASTPLDTKQLRSQLDKFRSTLNDKEKRLESDTLTDDDYLLLRRQVQEVLEQLNQVLESITPRIDALQQRLEQLGKKPEEGEGTESTDVTEERLSRQNAVTELKEIQKVGSSLSVQAQQLDAAITQQRRSLFTQSTFQRNYSLLSPHLWQEFFKSISEDISVSHSLLSQWAEYIIQALTRDLLFPFCILLSIGFFLYYLRKRLLRSIGRNREITHPSRRDRIFAAFRYLIVDLVPLILFFQAILLFMENYNLYPPQLQSLSIAFLNGLFLFSFARSLNDVLASPGNINWQIISMKTREAKNLRLFSETLYGWIAIKIIVDAYLKIIVASIPLSLVWNAFFAMVTSIMVLPILIGKTNKTPEPEKEKDEPETDERDVAPAAFLSILRTFGWAVIVLIFFALLSGYLFFASYLVRETGIILLIMGYTYFANLLFEEILLGTLKENNRVTNFLQGTVGFQKKSIEQFGVLASGLIKFAIIFIFCNIVLVRLRIESTSITSQLKSAFEGFQIGSISVSLSSITACCVILVIGVILTRMVRKWLEGTYFPVTRLDSGLKNSILTIWSYIGTAITLVLASSYIGLSLDKIAIVAGALSVGIGFGLQSIVNNFVSGLILLWERPIRVGDWVSVGGEEGYVRNIKVRSTEIQTSDRATVIVPNSSLISDTVINHVRLTRTRRIQIKIPLPRYADADAASKIMKDCALAHLEVLSQPDATVYFTNITETAIELLLICFVDDIDSAYRVTSELRFSVFREFRKVGLLPMASSPTRFVFDFGEDNSANNINALKEITAPKDEIGKEQEDARAQKNSV